MSGAPDFDLAVIGGGPGGYVAALRAAQLGMATVLVEREHLGGICLNWGCIPTKSLLHTADTLRRIEGAATLGLKVARPEVDFPRVIARSREVAAQLSRGVSMLLRKAGVRVIEGRASFSPTGTIEVWGPGGEQRIAVARTIVATGARPRELPALPFDGLRVWSYRDALQATALPASLAVIGAGAIGLEFASFFAALGTRVTLIEAQNTLLAGADAEVSAFLLQAFERQGISVRVGARLASANVGPNAVQLDVLAGDQRERLACERVLVAIGLAPNTQDLGLEHRQAVVRPHGIEVDGWGATADPSVFAIGDVTGAPMLAHRASHQGIACVERMAGLHAEQSAPANAIPACTYCHPQTASIGLTEAQARAAGGPVRVGRFPLQANGKAIAIGEPVGFVKTIFDGGTGALLGAHIVGAEATELIQGFALASTLEATEAELIETVFAHPTVSEAMHESVLAAFDRVLHV